MDKTYQPHAIETSWYNTWESENYFAPHIETEIKRRLDARMERLLSQYQS